MKARVLLISWACGCSASSHVDSASLALDAGAQPAASASMDASVARASDAGTPARPLLADAASAADAASPIARDAGGAHAASSTSDAASSLPPSAADADGGDECLTRELPGDAMPQRGNTPRMFVFTLAHPLGGIAAFQHGGSSLHSLATIQLALHGGAPVERYGDSTTPNCHALEVSMRLDVGLRSEDGALDEQWLLPARLDELTATLTIDAELGVSELHGGLRDQLAADAATSALDRLRFRFRSSDFSAHAEVFRSGQGASSALPVFDFEVRCKDSFPQYGKELWSAGADECQALDASPNANFPSTLASAPLDCIAKHVAAASPFGMTWDFFGGTTARRGSVMRLDQALASGGRAPYLEFVAVQGSNSASAEVRRCTSFKVTQPCEISGLGDDMSPCIECVMPGPWLPYCGSRVP